MQTVDLVIGGLGVVAVLATTLGVVLFDDLAGEQKVIFPEAVVHSHDETKEGESAGTVPFESALRDNATALRDVKVTITFTGTQGPNPDNSAGSYEVRIIPPNNVTCEPKQAAWSAQPVEITFSECRWLQPPDSRDSTDPGAIDETVAWDTPVRAEVEITNPTDLMQLVTVEYTYDVRLEYDEVAYAQTIDRPDLDTA